MAHGDAQRRNDKSEGDPVAFAHFLPRLACLYCDVAASVTWIYLPPLPVRFFAGLGLDLLVDFIVFFTVAFTFLATAFTFFAAFFTGASVFVAGSFVNLCPAAPPTIAPTAAPAGPSREP